MSALFVNKTRSGPDGAAPAGAIIIKGEPGNHAAHALLAELASLSLVGQAGKLVALKPDLSGFQLVDRP